MSLPEVRCPKCGKKFVPAPQHVYKENKKTYCTWTCFNHRAEGTNRPRSRAVLMYDKKGNFIARFDGATEAGLKINGNPNAIRDACNHGTRHKGYFWRYENDLP